MHFGCLPASCIFGALLIATPTAATNAIECKGKGATPQIIMGLSASDDADPTMTYPVVSIELRGSNYSFSSKRKGWNVLDQSKGTRTNAYLIDPRRTKIAHIQLRPTANDSSEWSYAGTLHFKRRTYWIKCFLG